MVSKHFHLDRFLKDLPREQGHLSGQSDSNHVPWKMCASLASYNHYILAIPDPFLKDDFNLYGLDRFIRNAVKATYKGPSYPTKYHQYDREHRSSESSSESATSLYGMDDPFELCKG